MVGAWDVSHGRGVAGTDGRGAKSTVSLALALALAGLAPSHLNSDLSVLDLDPFKRWNGWVWAGLEKLDLKWVGSSQARSKNVFSDLNILF